MSNDVEIDQQDPKSPGAQEMLDALWDEIQRRYEFTAPIALKPELFSDARGGFWIARANDEPVGSIGLIPLAEDTAELEAMYVAPGYRGTGVAKRLLQTLDDHARQHGFTSICLRAGEPQPEALHFYDKVGFKRIANYGRWVGDPAAWCFGKELA